jgi:hypothetical protein
VTVRTKKVRPILDLIDELNGDMSVPDVQTLEDLEEIQSDLDGKMEALREQIKIREHKERS